MARVLLIAPTCDGEDVGEAWVAFQWAKRLADRHDLTVLTYHKRGRTPASLQLPGVRVVEWAEPPLLGRYERLNSMLKPAYAPFYVRARRWIRRAIADGESFDLVHQPVPVAMRYPSPAAGLGFPLVIGPVGGGLCDPPGFGVGGADPWFMRLRNFDALRLRRDPLLRRTFSTASCVLGIAPYVEELLHDVPMRRFEVMSETALETLPEPTVRRPAATPIRLLFVGRLVRTKGARDLIRSLSLLPESLVVLDVVGDGPDRELCEGLVRELGLEDRVTFHGTQSRSAVDGFYRRADIFVFPSFREPGGNVALEAMGHGLPLIVADRGGPAGAVDRSCAMMLQITTPGRLVEELASAIETLATDSSLRASMGQAARARAQRTALWDAKIAHAEGIYESVVPGSRREPVSIICVFNNEEVRRDCLDRSMAVQHSLAPASELIAVNNVDQAFASAGAALNHGAAQARNDFLVFVHQDVYLHSLDALELAAGSMADDPSLGMLGAIGISREGAMVGRVRDRVVLLGAPTDVPTEVDTLDEVLFMLRRDRVVESALTEDADLAWHAYAVEYCLRTRADGLRVAALDMAITHNSLTVNLARLDEAHAAVAARYPSALPISTTCGRIGDGAATVGLKRFAGNHRWRYAWFRESLAACSARRASGSATVVLVDIRRRIDDLLDTEPIDCLEVINLLDDQRGHDGFKNPTSLLRGRHHVQVSAMSLAAIIDRVAALAPSESVLLTNLDVAALSLLRGVSSSLARVLGYHEGIGFWLLTGPLAGPAGELWTAPRERPLRLSWRA